MLDVIAANEAAVISASEPLENAWSQHEGAGVPASVPASAGTPASPAPGTVKSVSSRLSVPAGRGVGPSVIARLIACDRQCGQVPPQLQLVRLPLSSSRP
jgi:hypothetical protein